MVKYKKKCPICKKVLNYARSYTLKISIKEDWKCGSCSSKNRKKRVYSLEEQELRKKQNKEKRKIHDKKYYKKHKEEIRISHKKYRQKPETIEKRRKYHQKPEVIEKNKEYYQQEHIKEKGRICSKKYREKPGHKEKQKEYKKEYYQRPEVREKLRIKNRDKRKNPIERLYGNLSASLRHSLKRYSQGKLSKDKRSWEDIVGYTVQELKEHLEKQFETGMTWENYGLYGWHIDHKVPRYFFKFSSVEDVEFRYCWSLDNLQPLWAEDNLKKGNRIK